MAPAHRPGASRRQTGQFRPWPPANTPRIVEFRDSLPMTATGKILKRELARQEQPEPAPHPVTIMMPNESVRSAPATATAGLDEVSRGRVRPAPLQPELTNIHPRPITGT